jgi:hypothetical protein
MRHVLVTIFLCLLPLPALAQATPRALAETFLGTVQKGQIGPAYARLFEGSNMGPAQANSMSRTTEATLNPLGRVLGYDLVREENFGGSLTRLVYLLRSERHLTLWDMYFYRPGNRWFIAELNFSEKFHDLGPKK